jgi:RNA recognition motif-containing protein
MSFATHPPFTMMLVRLLNFDIVACSLMIEDTLESDLRDVFSAYGSVSKVNMPIDRETVSIIHTVNTVVIPIQLHNLHFSQIYY